MSFWLGQEITFPSNLVLSKDSHLGTLNFFSLVFRSLNSPKLRLDFLIFITSFGFTPKEGKSVFLLLTKL